MPKLVKLMKMPNRKTTQKVLEVKSIFRLPKLVFPSEYAIESDCVGPAGMPHNNSTNTSKAPAIKTID